MKMIDTIVPTPAETDEANVVDGPPKMSARGVGVFYGDKQALRDVSVDIHDDKVTAFIGPSGCGKSTFLRCLNRMNDTIAGARVTGDIDLDGEDIYASKMDVVQLRARVGMVFQKPTPSPSRSTKMSLRTTHHGLAAGKASWTRSSRIAQARRPVGRGQGSLNEQRPRPLSGRPAAAAVHRPRDCGRSRSHPDDEPCSALDPIATPRSRS
jgi:phosphate transport system ATP-binding protein